MDDDRKLGEWTSAELRRAICTAVEEIAQLDTERYALEEIRDDFEVKEHDLSLRLAAVKKECAALAGQFESGKRELGELGDEIRAAAREAAALRRQRAAIDTRLRALERESATLEEEVRRSRGDVSSVENTLQIVHESIVRMDRKLGTTERKFGPSAPRSVTPRRLSTDE